MGLLALGRVVHHVEGVLRGTAGVVLGGVERGEVVVGRLDVGTILNGIAQSHEDVLDLLANLRDEVLRPRGELTSGQRDISGVCRHAPGENRTVELGPASLDGLIDVGAHRVGELAHVISERL